MNRIIPKPNGLVRRSEGYFLLKNLTSVCKNNFSERATKAFTDRLGIALTEVTKEATLQLVTDVTLAPEEYQLSVSENGVKVIAATDNGVIWALTSLYELLENDGFPYIIIEDKPKYQHRGFLLDCARHFFPLEVVKQIIEENALVKLNTLHWHLTNDQGWRMESKAFPQLHQLAGQEYYTREQMQEIVEFALVRGVEVIPEINMPGHTLAAIAAYPELSCQGEAVEMATQGGIYEIILCAGKETTYEFAKKILDEICEIFISKYVHLGGDEAPKVAWANCPHCQAKLVETGSANFEELQGYFMNELVAHLAKKGRVAMLWNDTLKAQNITQEAIAQYWLEIGAEDYARKFIKEGGQMIFSDMFSLYFDYTECFSGLQRVYDYMPTIKGENFSEDENCLGVQACLWSERVVDRSTLYQRIYPRLFALAEAGWTVQRDYTDFTERLAVKLKKLDEKGINYQPLARCNPQGSERITEVMQFMQALAAAGRDGSAPAFTPEMIQQFLIGFGLEELLSMLS